MSVHISPFIPVIEEVKWERATKSGFSTVSGFLPAALQSRMGQFRHFRRSASLGSLRTTELVGASSPKPQPHSASETMEYPDRKVTSVDLKGDGSQSGSSTPARVSRSPTVKDVGSTFTSGINWRLANQGANLIDIAADASTTVGSDDFERKAYLHGLTYLLRGLPRDVDASEMEQIRSALPRGMALEDNASVQPGTASPGSNSELPKSFVHRMVQMIVFNLFLLIRFLLPYIIHLGTLVAKLERKYKLSETVIGHGVNCFSAAGKHCAYVAEVVFQANNGEVGREVSSGFAWTVEEVTRGISDGVGEGIVVTRSKDFSSPRLR